MENTIILNPQHVLQALNVILKTQDEQMRIKANEYLRVLEQSQQEFPLLLIQIYQEENEPLNKLQSLLLLKNVIVRNWIKAQIVKGKKVNNLSEETKTKIRYLVVQLLNLCRDQREINIFNQILQTIAKYDFPGKFIDLEQYFYKKLQEITLQPSFTENLQIIYSYLTSLKSVQQELVKNKLMAFRVQQKGFSLKFLPFYIQLWKSISTLQQQQIHSSEVMKISSKSDRILGYLIMFLHYEENLSIISEAFRILLEKTAFLIKTQGQSNLQSQIKTLTQVLINIQQLFPVSIGQWLQDYFQLILLLINKEWNDQRLKNIAIIGLTKLLQINLYYCTSEQFKSIIPYPKTAQYLELREQCHILFKQFFNQNLSYLIERIVILNQQNHQQFMNCEMELDGETSQCIKKEEQEEKSDIHKQCQILCLECCEQIIQRFPLETLNYIQQNLYSLRGKNFESIKLETLDSFLQIVERFCKLQQKQQDQILSIIEILDYIEQFDSPYIQFRFIQIGYIYLNLFNEQQINQFLNKMKILVLNLNQRIQILSLACLKDVLQVFKNSEFQISEIVFDLISLINTIIKKGNFTLYQSAIFGLLEQILTIFVFQKGKNEQFQQQFFVKLIDLFTDEEDIFHFGICNLFKKLLLQFPYQKVPNEFFQITICYFNINFTKNLNEINEAFLQILQEYNRDENNNIFGQNLKELFVTHQQILFSKPESSLSIKMLEELILMRLIAQKLNLFKEFLYLCVSKLSSLEQIPKNFDFYLQILSLFETIVFTQEIELNDQIQIQFLTTVVQFLIMLNQIEDKSFKCCEMKNKIFNIINFYFLRNENFVMQLLNQSLLRISEYFNLWQAQSINITVKGDQRRNNLSTLKFLKYIPNQFLKQYLNQILKESLTYIQFESDLQNVQFITQQKQNQLKFFSSEKIRIDQERRSYRKEKLLNDFLDKPQENMYQILFCEISEIVQRHKLFNNQEFQIDEKVLNQLNTLLFEC